MAQSAIVQLQNDDDSKQEEEEEEEESPDALNLGQNADIQAMIAKHGWMKERVVFSSQICKLNRNGRRQDRVIIITQKAVYLLKPKKLKAPQRRINIMDIGMLTLSAASLEFVVHCPASYDSHFVSNRKEEIALLLSRLYWNETHTKLVVVYSQCKQLKEFVITKKMAKFENKSTKHAMQQTFTSMKDIMNEIEENEFADADQDEESQIHVVYSDDEQDVEEEEI